MNLAVSIVALGLAAVAACTAPKVLTPDVRTSTGIRGNANLSAITREVHDLVNDYRRKKGLQVLDWNEAAAAQALQHSQNMASKKVPFGHGGFDNRVKYIRAQTPNTFGFAENVAMGYPTAQEVVKGWINSPGHRKNMEGNFNAAGIGIASNGELWYTQIFVLRK